MKGIIALHKDVNGNDYLAIDIAPLKMARAVTTFKFEVPDADKKEENKFNRDGRFKWHMTVINVMEYAKLSKSEFHLPYEVNFNMIGIGSATRNDNTTYFVVCESVELDKIREKFDLPKQNFHITLGFDKKDVFGVPKDRSSLLYSF